MRVPRVIIAATASDVGKTTVVCGLLRALTRRGLRLRACKCGPDYIDPQFHRAVLGVPSCNLDLFMSSESLVRGLLVRGAGSDLTIVEGAMGYYDGIAQSHDASAYDVARVTRTPAVLVVDARGRSLSIAAEVAGYVGFREPSFVAGVILNRASAGYAPTLKAMVEEQAGVPVLGYVPQLDDVRLERRHLGLVAADEVTKLCDKIDALADTLTRTVDLDALLSLACIAEPLEVEACDEAGLSHPAVYRAGEKGSHERASHSERKRSEAIDGADDFERAHPIIAVARDEAFSFYYDETLDLLERLGARLALFSPLHDSSLPSGACGLYVGGGYPELYARELSENTAMVDAVRLAIEDGMPTIAECGGFLYLHEELEDAEGTYWPLVGAVSGRAYKTDRLRRFGYITLTARRDGLLARTGERLRAHEFHYWESDDPGDAFHAQKPQSARSWDCVISTPTLYAGFPHLYLAGQPEVARRFVEACATYGTGDRQQVRREGVS